MKIKIQLLILSVLFGVCVVMLFVPSVFAMSYQEKKDRDGLATMKRALTRVPLDKNIFEGKRIVAGTNPVQVRLYFDALNVQLKSAQSAWRNISTKGRATQKGRELVGQYNAYQAYVKELSNSYPNYNPQQQVLKPKEACRREAIKSNIDTIKKNTLEQICEKFRGQISSLDKKRMRWLVDLSNGQDLFVQETNEIKQYRESMQKVNAVCSNPEFNNIQESCQAMTSVSTDREGAYCDAVKKGNELLTKAVTNYAAFLSQQKGSNATVSTQSLKQQKGWVKLEGAVNRSSLSKGGRLSDVILKRLQPMFAEVGLKAANSSAVFKKLNSRSNQLRKAIKELALGWDVPGSTCEGAPCSIANDTFERWYPKSKILKVTQKDGSWKIRHNKVRNLPIERYLAGWTLLQVPDEPF